jgi:hypothetical protein
MNSGLRWWLSGSMFLVGSWGLAAAMDSTGAAGNPDLSAKMQQAQEAVKRFLESRKAPLIPPQGLHDASLMDIFPDHIFLVLRFPQFPVARIPPPGLGANNLFCMLPDKKLVHLTKAEELPKFFQEHAVPVKETQQARQAIKAWLLLSQELHQDGFYRFEILEKEITIKKNGQLAVSGRAVVMRGGNGALTVQLEFDAAGKLARAQEDIQLRPGPRPICQARKLLDPDPVVRRMAEQELLYLGRLAGPYLEAQRRTAGPALRQAIDRLWQRILREDP